MLKYILNNLMKKLVCLLLVTNGILCVWGQSENKGKFVEIPSDITLLVIANQRNCPIKIEEAKLFLNLDNNKTFFTFRIRNLSKKIINGFDLSKWNLGGSGGDIIGLTPDKSPLLPHGTINIGRLNSSDIVSIDDNIQKTLRQNKVMSNVIVLFVNAVWFKDGTKFDDAKTYDNLRNFSNNINLEIN